MASEQTKTFKGISNQTLITILGGVVEVVYFSCMSRLLTKEEFGLYAVATSVTAIITSLSEAGLGSTIIQKKDPSNKFINTAFTLSLTLGLFFSLFLFLSAGVLSKLLISSDDLTLPLRIMAAMPLLNCLIGVARAMFMRRLNFLTYGFISITINAVCYGIGVWMAYNGYGIYSVITATIMSMLLTVIVLYLLCNYKPKVEIDRGEVRGILSYGGWLTACVIVRTINDQLTSLIMPKITSVTLLGTYNRPARLVSIISDKINGIFDTVLFPILSGIQDNVVKVRSAFYKTYSLIGLSSFLLSFVLILASDILIKIFLGNQWNELEGLLQLISLSVVFSSFSRMSDCFLRSLGEMKVYFIIRCSTFVATFVVVIVGCQFGLYGVAIAYVGAKLFDAIIKIAYLIKHLHFSFNKFACHVLKGAIVPLILFVPCYLLHTLLHVNGLFTAGLFGCALLYIMFAFPKLLGDVYHESIYQIYLVKVKNKMFKNHE